MSNNAIIVENLSKRYRIGLKEELHDTLSGALMSWIKSPVNNYRKLRKLTTFNNNDDDIIWALKNVTFELKEGQVIGIIGRNGSGKSTLLKVLSRITAPTAGRVVIYGRVSSLLEVGTGFHPELTGRENIYLNGAILGMTKHEIDTKFEEIVAFSAIEKFIDTPVKRYSSGMRIRLAFSVAAHLEPEILLVDEVLAVGDAEFQNKCIGKMQNVAQEGRTVLFVSHNMAAISALCEKAMLLDYGSIKSFGQTDKVIAAYLKNTSINQDNEFISDKCVRDGNGLIRFQKWFVHDDIYGQGRSVGSMNSCKFELHYKADSQIELKNVDVAITIKDALNQPLMTVATDIRNSVFNRISSKGVFICEVEQLPLIPGIYKIYLWCSINHDPADRIQDAGNLNILPVDVYGSGKLPIKKQGPVLLNYEWFYNDLLENNINQ